MSSFMRRGACPSLSAPMQTGDGLLVRLNPRFGILSPRQLAGVAKAAERHGNGILEITSRGSLQVRGVREDRTEALAADVSALEIDAVQGLATSVGPLAGLGAGEIADPRPLAEEIGRRAEAAGLPQRLAPKVSVVVDGGGALNLSGVLGDVRIEADDDGWVVMAGGSRGNARVVGRGDAEDAAEAVLALLETLADGGRTTRGRDLPAEALASISARLKPAAKRDRAAAKAPVGEFPLRDGSMALGFALSFGQISGGDLFEFSESIDTSIEIHLAPGKGLLLVGLSEDDRQRVLASAERLGLVTRPDDPRLLIVTCAGAPDCASAFLRTRDIASRLIQMHAADLPREAMLHISGCAKQCARPAGPSLSLVGSDMGCEIIAEGLDGGSGIRRILSDLAAPHAPGRRRSA